MNARLLLMIPSLGGGGAERQIVTLAVFLKNRGYNVEFLVFFEDAFYEKTLIDEGIKINRRVCKGLKRIMYISSFIRKGGYDKIISFTPTPNFLNCFSSILNHKRLVIISERSARESNLTSLKGRVYAWFYQRANCIVCNSDNAKNMWIIHYPQYSDRLITIYNAVRDLTVTSRYIPKRDGKLNVVVAATIYKTKNPMNVIKALLLMDNNERKLLHIDWFGKKEAIHGDRTEYDLVVKTIEESSLGDVITIHDATMDIANRMNEADCVALFSVLEGLPNAICEGMSLGKPIVMSRCSDYNIIVREGSNGYLCDWDNPLSIKEALLKMARLKQFELLEMGAVSKKLAEELFSRERVLEQWVSVLES